MSQNRVIHITETNHMSKSPYPSRHMATLVLCCWSPNGNIGSERIKWVNTFFFYQEGAISVWYPSMQYERYYVISDDNEDTSGQKRRFKMWVTDAIYMPNCQKIAISSTSRDIRFFDTSTSQYFEEYHLFGKCGFYRINERVSLLRSTIFGPQREKTCLRCM